MSKQSLAKALAQMQASLTEKVVGFCSKTIRETTKEIAEELQIEYDYFFQMIVDDVIGELQTPGILAPYTTWKPLSKHWIKAKATSQHYIGLSNRLTVGRALGRKSRNGRSIGISRLRSNGVKPQGFVKVGPFESYIRSLTGKGTTERFFGPLKIDYDFQTGDPNITVYTQRDGAIVKRTQFRANRGFVATPSSLKFKATISAFSALKGVTFNEKAIVDYIIKRIDPVNEKQWVKINSSYGIGRSRRPIREIMTPTLRYYMQKRFPEIVQAAIKARR